MFGILKFSSPIFNHICRKLSIEAKGRSVLSLQKMLVKGPVYGIASI